MNSISSSQAIQNATYTAGTAQNTLAHVYQPVQYREGRKTVTEYNYDLPKGQHSNLVGSFQYTVPTQKSGQLRAKVEIQKRKLQTLQARENITGKRNPKKKKALRCSIRYLENQLANEVASQPVVKVNVHEKDLED